jgi:hypothetical protein
LHQRIDLLPGNLSRARQLFKLFSHTDSRASFKEVAF